MDIKELTKVQKDREDKLKKLRSEGFNFPNDFEKKDQIGDLVESYGSLTKDKLASKKVAVKTAGRIILKRVMGNAAFMTFEDPTGRIQTYFSKDNLAKELDSVKELDMGDIIGVEGSLFRTKTDELTIEVKKIRLLTKSLKPMPEKHKGLTDIETIYRQRYVD
jgi:Lysyl-tRNA synthetase (class II)